MLIGLLASGADQQPVRCRNDLVWQFWSGRRASLHRRCRILGDRPGSAVRSADPFTTGLDFDPTSFVSTANGGALDVTDGQLNFTVMSTAAGAIIAINLFEARRFLADRNRHFGHSGAGRGHHFRRP